jgi:cytoskeleton protein RodZ
VCSLGRRMTDIGQTLREARMRAKIDITDVETATKIRAKYLRALENEEWNLLPGPTFVKSFLRTYAQYLGLDARLLVEEYKRRFERPADEGPPLGTPLGRERERRGMPTPPLLSPRVLAIGAAVIVIVGLLYGLGKWGSSGGGGNKPTTTPTTAATTPPKKAKRKKHTAAKPKLASLRLIPTGPVYACVIDDKGTKRVPGQTITPTTTLRTWHAKRFLITVGNSQLSMRVNGKTLPVPASTGATNFVVTSAGRHTRPAGQGPNCG